MSDFRVRPVHPVMRQLGVLVLVAAMLSPAAAFAQGGQYGSIIGYVYDQSGTPLRGVKVSARSDTQIGGVKIAYTNEEGYFRLVALQPGEFEVLASAPKMQTVVQKDVKVGISVPSEVNLIMEVEAAVEEVKIVQKPPIISTTTANLKEEFDLDFIEALPLASRADPQMYNDTGGVVNGHIRGGGTNQLFYSQDGFDMKGQAPTMKSAAAYEIQAGGYGAENAMASGGIVNLVTKSGSNKFEFEFNGTAESSYLRFFTDGTDSKTPTYMYIVNPSISGPIIRDRLWYAFNMEMQVIQNGRDKDPNGYLPDPLTYGKLLPKGTLKLTWQVSPRNKLQTITNFDMPSEYNRIDGLGVTADAQQNRHTDRLFQGAVFESLLSDTLVLRSQVGYTYLPENIYPKRCIDDPVTCDHIPAYANNWPVRQTYNNATDHLRNDNYTFQFRNRLEWFVATKGLGEHNFTIHDFFYTEEQVNKTSHPGDRFIEYNGTDPQQVTYYYANDPRYEPARTGWFIKSTSVYRHLGTIADSWRLTRYLTMTPALSHVWATGTNSRGDRAIDQTTFAPSMSLAWDATHDGRTVIRSSYNTYVDVDVYALANHTVGSQTSQRCQWDPATGDFTRSCSYSGGLTRNTFGLPCGPNGVNPDGSSCREALRIPQTWEYTFGAEREVIQGLALSGDLVYRKYLHQYETRETNRIWNASGTDLQPTASYRNGRNETVSDLETPDGAQRRYVGATFGIKKREGRLKIFTYYTLSMLQGNVVDSLDGTFGQIPPRDTYLFGYLPDDHRHEIKTTMVYQFTNWLTSGVRYNYFSGFPYNRLYRNDVTGGSDNYRAQRGMDPGGNVNDPGDDRQLRLPDRQSLSVQVRVNWMPLIGQRLDTFVDVLNVMALRTTTSVQQNDGPFFGTQSGRMGPMSVRLGLNYRY